MRTINIVGLVLMVAVCLGGELSLEDLYKRADAAEHAAPPPPPKVHHVEDDRWSTDSLLGWNKQEKSDIFTDMLKRHKVTEDEALGNAKASKAKKMKKTKKTKKIVKIKKVQKVQKVQQIQKIKKAPKVQKVKKAKKVIKAALVAKGRAKAKKVLAVKSTAPVTVASIVPEHNQADMLSAHFFDGTATKPHVQKQPKKAVPAKSSKHESSTNALLAGMGMHVDGLSSRQEHSAKLHKTDLSALSSDLLGSAQKTEKKAVAAKKAAKKQAAAAKAAAAKAAKQKTAKKAKEDPLHMQLNDDSSTTTAVPDEKKLPALGSMLDFGGDDQCKAHSVRTAILMMKRVF